MDAVGLATQEWRLKTFTGEAGYDRATPLVEKRLRIAAYCRVSTDLDEQDGSYEAPVSYTHLDVYKRQP